MSKTSDQSVDSGIDPNASSPAAVENLASQRLYNPDDSEELTTTIVGAVADAEGVDLTAVERPPLYHAVDPSALEAILFRDSTRYDASSVRTVEFSYHGYRIRLDPTGLVRVFENPSN